MDGMPSSSQSPTSEELLDDSSTKKKGHVDEQDIADAISILIDEDSSMNWTMKQWRTVVSEKLGVAAGVFDQPHLKAALKDIVLEQSAQFIEHLSQSQSQSFDDLLPFGASGEQELGVNESDADDSSVSIAWKAPKKKNKKAKQEKKAKKIRKTEKSPAFGNDENEQPQNLEVVVGEEVADEDDMGSVHSDSDSSVGSASTTSSVRSGASVDSADILPSGRGKRKATKDPKLKRKPAVEKKTDPNRVANEELEVAKAIDSGDTQGLVSAAEFVMQRYE